MMLQTVILFGIGIILYFGLRDIVEIIDKILIELKKLNNNEKNNS